METKGQISCTIVRWQTVGSMRTCVSSVDMIEENSQEPKSSSNMQKGFLSYMFKDLMYLKQVCMKAWKPVCYNIFKDRERKQVRSRNPYRPEIDKSFNNK